MSQKNNPKQTLGVPELLPVDLGLLGRTAGVSGDGGAVRSGLAKSIGLIRIEDGDARHTIVSFCPSRVATPPSCPPGIGERLPAGVAFDESEYAMFAWERRNAQRALFPPL